MDLELTGLAIALIAYYRTRRRRDKARSCWAKPYLLRRMQLGVGATLLRELACEAPKDFKNYLRMDHGTFIDLLNKVSPIITKKDTTFRTSVSAEERLAVTLRFLATGESQRSLHYSFRIAPSTLCEIIPETMEAIYDTLRHDYLSVPTSSGQWEKVAKGFHYSWQFPHCLGALDGKHVRIVPPPKTGSDYYNYKNYFSVVLMAVVDSEYKFVFADCGTNGRISDGGVWSKCKLYEAVEDNTVEIPQPCRLPGSDRIAPYVFVADEAFGLTPYMMRPYPGRNLNNDERLYNYRLSRARRVVENAFGILANRWRILLTAINFGSIEKTKMAVMACVTLHNYLACRSSMQNPYIDAADVDRENERGEIVPAQWRSDQQLDQVQRIGHRPLDMAKQIQNVFKEYFVNEGAVPWQDQRV